MSDFDPATLLKKARAQAQLTQRALAEKAGTSQSVVARIELGTTSPTADTLNRLLEATDHELTVELRERSAGGVDVPGLVHKVRKFFRAGRVPGIASVYLFGSSSRGGRHRESDVDLAVLLDRTVYPALEQRTDLRITLMSALIEATGVNEIDLVVLNDVPPGFGRSIVVEGRRLLCLDAELDHAFVRDVQLRWADLAPFLRRTAAVKLQALAR